MLIALSISLSPTLWEGKLYLIAFTDKLLVLAATEHVCLCVTQAPVVVVLPHCTSRASAMTREPIIKALIGSVWVELRSSEVTIEDKKVNNLSEHLYFVYQTAPRLDWSIEHNIYCTF